MYYQQLVMSVMAEVSTYNSLRHEQTNLYTVTVWSHILIVFTLTWFSSNWSVNRAKPCLAKPYWDLLTEPGKPTLVQYSCATSVNVMLAMLTVSKVSNVRCMQTVFLQVKMDKSRTNK